MSGRLRKTDRAKRDIEHISDWIFRESPAAAEKWLDDLDEKLQIIAATPGVGTNRSDLRPGIRSYAFGNYLIFFKPTKAGVDIVRIIHGARDYRGFFK